MNRVIKELYLKCVKENQVKYSLKFIIEAGGSYTASKQVITYLPFTYEELTLSEEILKYCDE